jgi:hypothetical protein
MRYQFFVIMLKLNLFFIAGVSAQFMVSIYFATKTHDAAQSIKDFVWAAVFINFFLFAYFIAGHVAVRQRSKPLMYVFMGIMLANLAVMGVILSYSVSDYRFVPTRIWISGFGTLA